MSSDMEHVPGEAIIFLNEPGSVDAIVADHADIGCVLRSQAAFETDDPFYVLYVDPAVLPAAELVERLKADARVRSAYLNEIEGIE